MIKYDHPAYRDWENRVIEPDSGPTHLTVSSTGKCNLTCFMCFHSFAKEVPVTMRREGIDPFLQKAQRVFLAGGEPLWLTDTVNRRGKELFESLLTEHRHLKINAFTNGVLLDGNIANTILDRFESIHFSIDTLDEARYEKVRGRPLLKKVLENLERLGEMKRARGLKPADEPRLNMNTIIMNSTVRELPALARKLVDVGGYKHILVNLFNIFGFADAQSLRNYLSDNGTFETERDASEGERAIRKMQIESERELFRPADFGPDLLDGLRREVRAIHGRGGIEVEDQANFFGGEATAKPKPQEPDTVCPSPWVTADIRENGDVYCCCRNSLRLGNVNGEDFREIWNGPVAKEIRRSFIAGNMTGCIQNGCPAIYDYFSLGEDSLDSVLLESIRSAFGQRTDVATILLFRTAPNYRCHLVARTLRHLFPKARIAVVTNKAGEEDCHAWGVEVEVLSYPENYFEPRAFFSWWQTARNVGRYDIAAAVYNNNRRLGYEGVEEIIARSPATVKIGIPPDGKLVRL